MVQNYDYIAISQLGNTKLEKKKLAEKKLQKMFTKGFFSAYDTIINQLQNSITIQLQIQLSKFVLGELPPGKLPSNKLPSGRLLPG